MIFSIFTHCVCDIIPIPILSNVPWGCFSIPSTFHSKMLHLINHTPKYHPNQEKNTPHFTHGNYCLFSPIFCLWMFFVVSVSKNVLSLCHSWLRYTIPIHFFFLSFLLYLPTLNFIYISIKTVIYNTRCANKTWKIFEMPLHISREAYSRVAKILQLFCYEK